MNFYPIEKGGEKRIGEFRPCFSVSAATGRSLRGLPLRQSWQGNLYKENQKMRKLERRSKLHVDALVNLRHPYLGAFFQAAFLKLFKYATHKDLDEIEQALAHFKKEQEKEERCSKDR